MQVKSDHMPVIDSYTINQFENYFDTLMIVFFYFLLIIFIKTNLQHSTDSQDLKVQYSYSLDFTTTLRN